MVNIDATSLPKRAAKLFYPLITKAYCRTK
jgi:hypothetical protein